MSDGTTAVTSTDTQRDGASPAAGSLTPERIAADLTEFLAARVNGEVAPDQDLFATGLVSSMFAMQLVVHLEASYDVAVVGPDLRLDNFRTIDRMAALVLRLKAEESGEASAPAGSESSGE